MTAINPADCKPGEIYEGVAWGATWILQRDAIDGQWVGITRLAATGFVTRKMFDADVSALVRLVPARPVTRDDLPGVHWPGIHGDGERAGADMMINAVVERLNANGGVPTSREDAALADRLERQAATISELQGSLLRVERERDEARTASYYATGRAEAAHAERLVAIRVKGEQVDRAEKAERECDEWQARAEKAETERDEALAALAECQADPRDFELPMVSRREERYHLFGVASYPWCDRDGRIADEDIEAEEARRQARDCLASAARFEAVARAIEAEQLSGSAEEEAIAESITSARVDASGLVDAVRQREDALQAILKLHKSDGHEPWSCGEEGCSASCLECEWPFPCRTFLAASAAIV